MGHGSFSPTAKPPMRGNNVAGILVRTEVFGESDYAIIHRVHTKMSTGHSERRASNHSDSSQKHLITSSPGYPREGAVSANTAKHRQPGSNTPPRLALLQSWSSCCQQSLWHTDHFHSGDQYSANKRSLRTGFSIEPRACDRPPPSEPSRSLSPELSFSIHRG